VTALALAVEFPIRDVRFVGGRTRHRVQRPDDQQWWQLLEAACGKTGFLASGYMVGAVGECRRCSRIVECGT